MCDSVINMGGVDDRGDSGVQLLVLPRQKESCEHRDNLLTLIAHSELYGDHVVSKGSV